jgi:hypothetical protein
LIETSIKASSSVMADDEELRRLPLVDRRARLHELVAGVPGEDGSISLKARREPGGSSTGRARQHWLVHIALCLFIIFFFLDFFCMCRCDAGWDVAAADMIGLVSARTRAVACVERGVGAD